jgi:hypothetical protein
MMATIIVAIKWYAILALLEMVAILVLLIMFMLRRSAVFSNARASYRWYRDCLLLRMRIITVKEFAKRCGFPDEEIAQ